jgi:hypothetical protein
MGVIITPAQALWRPGPSRRRRPADVIDTPGVSGVSNLPRKITVNGTTVDSATSGFFYDFTDAAGASGSMTLAEDNGQSAGALSEVVVSGALTRSVSGPWIDGSTGVTGNGSNRLTAPGNSFGDLGTKHFWIDCAMRLNTQANHTIFGKHSSTGLQVGYFSGLRFLIGGAAGSISGACGLGWHFFSLVYAGTAGSVAKIYLDGSQLATGDLSGIADLTKDVPWGIFTNNGGDAASSAGSTDTIAHLALFLATDLGSDADAFLATHKERCNRVFGTYAAQARGAARTLSVTRTGVRYFDVGAQGIHALGAGGHCVEEDADGARYVSVYGEYENVQDEPTDRTAWTNDGSTDGDAGVESPIAGLNWNTLAEDSSTSNQHRIYRDATAAPAQNQKCLVQCFVENIDRGYAILRGSMDGGSGAYAQSGFNLSTGARESATDGLDGTNHASGAIPLSGGGYILWLICSTAAATPTSFLGHLYLSPDGSTDTYNGDGSSSIRWTGIQQVIGATGPLPYIAGGETKPAEVLKRPVAWIPDGAFTIELMVRGWGVNQAAGYNYVFAISDGTNDHRIQAYAGTLGFYVVTSEPAGNAGSAAPAVNIFDGEWHRVSIAHDGVERLSVKVDNTQAVDASATRPTGLTEFWLGNNTSGTGMQLLDGDIRVDPPYGMRIYPYARH